jgi:hypothetical protein
MGGESTISASAAATVRLDAPELGAPESYEAAVTDDFAERIFLPPFVLTP